MLPDLDSTVSPEWRSNTPASIPSLEVLDPQRVIAIRLIKTVQEMTVLLVDEKIGKPLAVIGKTIS